LARDGLLRLPDRIQRQFWDKIESVVPFARDHVFLSDQPDYARTQVFPGSVYSGLLYFNLVGREPTGVVPPEERHELASQIASELRQIEEPETGQPLLAHVYTARELYTGSATEHGPELIIDSYDSGWGIQASKYVPTSEPMSDGYFVEVGYQRDFGWHGRDGIFVFLGQDFQAGPAPCQGHVMDIPATLLHVYGVPIPEDYDGQVLTELMISEVGQKPIRYQPGDVETTSSVDHSYSTEEEEELVNHLRALGYLD
jgi:predicted AlkP superfamily phosphohydrolase/phosphomutase